VTLLNPGGSGLWTTLDATQGVPGVYDATEILKRTGVAWYWATVIDTNPLTIQLDGTNVPLNLIPESLVDPALLTIGSRVWCQLHRHQVIVLGVSGNSPYLTASWDEEIDGITTSSTSYTFGSPTCGAAFIAPISGIVLVQYTAQWEPATTNTCGCQTEVRAGTSTGGTLHQAGGTARYRMQTGTSGGVGMSNGQLLVTGLTPGDQYTAWLTHIVGGGTGHTISERRIVVRPQP
jgi:hypothetical protein